MGKPAARIGDMTMHGGSIVVGCPTVLIGGMPAARLGDMHVCPMMTPGTPPIPHVGGPVSLGSTGVLIGGQPAARMGDMCVCVGPPDSVALGCMTVLIGEAGGGGGGGGGGGAGSAASAANASAAVAQQGNLESTTKREHWVEFQFVDKAGLPVSGVPYKFTDPGGNESRGILKSNGRVRRDALANGLCKVQLSKLSNPMWSKNNAEVGDKVNATCEALGYEDRTKVEVIIWRRDLVGSDAVVGHIESFVLSEKIQVEWEYESETEASDHQERKGLPRSFHSPQFYCEFVVENDVVRTPMLKYSDFIDVEVVDLNGSPVPGTRYIVVADDGRVLRGQVSGNGKSREKGIPPGSCGVRAE